MKFRVRREVSHWRIPYRTLRFKIINNDSDPTKGLRYQSEIDTGTHERPHERDEGKIHLMPRLHEISSFFFYSTSFRVLEANIFTILYIYFIFSQNNF